MNSEKRPRHYAHEIARLQTKDERIAALEKAPKEWQSLIKAHVTSTFLHNKYRK